MEANTIQELQSRALELPAEDRARLLEALLASFDPPANPPQAWIQEATHRQAAVQNGLVEMVPGDLALARVKARLG